MSPARVISAGLLTGLALLLAFVLLALAASLPQTYGPDASDGMLPMAFLPALAAFGAAFTIDADRRALLAATVFSVLVAVGVPMAARHGAETWTEDMADRDESFTCNGPSAEAQVPEAVDAAWHTMDHPAPFWLYGPIQGSPHGCTAAIYGSPEQAFAAWRAALLDVGWRVVRDDTEVTVVRDGVRLTLYVEGAQAYLQAAPSQVGGCQGGRASAEDGTVSAC